MGCFGFQLGMGLRRQQDVQKARMPIDLASDEAGLLMRALDLSAQLAPCAGYRQIKVPLNSYKFWECPA